ncbi:alginate O-acetyltransferase complex protein AlgJ [Pseudomonas benzenivorans]|nr:alginate O-acetyltransferase [Pseudomonas benzenivorans]SDG85500.1 alginate O-acetyltransferase complex protein AlgJ [Pseudomonas benzenivorans]
MTRPLRKLYVALFLGALVLVFLWSLRGVLSYQLPNRFSVLDGGLAKTFESHYDKQLPVKEIGTNVWAALDYLLFGEGRPGVLVGSDDWLFSDEEFKPVEGARQNLRDNLALIQGVRDELARRDIALVLAIVPAKARLYPEHLGEHRASSLQQRLYQEFHVAARGAGITAPDLLGPLQQAKQQGPLFLRTDTHWTPLGAEIVARQLGAAVSQSLALGGEPQQFVTEAGEQAPYKGDLTRFLPLDPLFAELLPAPDPLQKHQTRAVDQASGADALFADSELPVTLVGTSYSANPNWNFAGALRQHLQRDLSNHAEDGHGPLLPMLKYLQSEELKNAAPQLVIWEFPERYLPMANDLSDFDPAWIAELKDRTGNQGLATTASR